MKLGMSKAEQSNGGGEQSGGRKENERQGRVNNRESVKHSAFCSKPNNIIHRESPTNAKLVFCAIRKHLNVILHKIYMCFLSLIFTGCVFAFNSAYTGYYSLFQPLFPSVKWIMVLITPHFVLFFPFIHCIDIHH